MLIRLFVWIGNWQLAARCQFDLRGFKTIKISFKYYNLVCSWSWLPVASCRLPIQSATGKWQLTSHYRCQFAILTNWLPIASCRLPIQSATGKWQLTSHSGCRFANSSELTTGNWHPDANSIWESLKQLKLNRNFANGSQMPIRTF